MLHCELLYHVGIYFTIVYTIAAAGQYITTWESAHMGKWGHLTPWKMDEKLKSVNMQKEQFSVFLLYFDSNQGRQM